QYQNEVNDIRAERIAISANPLALLAAAQPYSDNYYQAPKPQRSNATSSSTRPSASTRHKGKEVAKPITPQSESVSEEDSDPEQAPRAWYDEFSNFLMSKGFTKGLQIHQSPKGIFINQAKYALEILKKHNMDNCHSIGTPLATKPKLDVDLSGEPVDQSDYHSKIGSLMYLTSSRPDLVQAVCYYADHAGCIDTRKSTSGGIQFLGDKLVSWMSKKQNCTAMSSAEAEYVALSASCAQVMWMRTQLQDYGFNYNKIPLYCDSQSAIAISCNPVQHSRNKRTSYSLSFH
ncbi:retrovirus-related pol polyprotein from transposon TNT 1-94, partial [Tanacetum coccineum]